MANIRGFRGEFSDGFGAVLEEPQESDVHAIERQLGRRFFPVTYSWKRTGHERLMRNLIATSTFPKRTDLPHPRGTAYDSSKKLRF
jgi:hypothetical protein